MDKSDLELISVNRDAIATNRGFYFQYLNLLKKWLQNFVDGKDERLFSEVGDDIKEVGDTLSFTQVKCYTGLFSLNTKEVKTALFAFYINYLKEKDNYPLSFSFISNTGLTKKEKLLRDWIDHLPLEEGELKARCARRICAILEDELKKGLRSRLERRGQTEEKQMLIRSAYQVAFGELQLNCTAFVGTINWKFGELPTDLSVEKLLSEVRLLIRSQRFASRPVELLINVLLSEIYSRSQKTEEADRFLDSALIERLLEKTDQQLEGFIDQRISMLFRSEITRIMEEIYSIKSRLDRQGDKLADLEKRVDGSPKQLAKNLTQLPIMGLVNFVERSNELKVLHKLVVTARHVNVHAPGGMGKSTFAKLYIRENYNDFDHVIWVDAEGGIVQSLVLDEQIAIALDLPISQSEGRSAAILFKLNQLNGNNIIVVDSAGEDRGGFKYISSLTNWMVLQTSRAKNPLSANFLLEGLGFQQAKMLFGKYCGIAVSDGALLEFFEFVEYNTLMIELTAKTISNSIDLTLGSFVSYLKNQALDDEELEIHVARADTEENVRILTFLQATYRMDGLSEHERWLIEFLSLFPGEDILISDLVAMAGSSHYSRNKTYFLNHMSSLDRKGWVIKNGDMVSMHRLVQQTAIYNMRSKKSFIGFAFFIIWLTARLQEGHQGFPGISIRFLRYGESILNSIQEKDRNGIYQPMLILENEILLLYMKLSSDIDLLQRWQGLAYRAKQYLSSNDPLLGTILSNFALSLAQNDKDQEAIANLLTAKEIFKANGTITSMHLVSCLTSIGMAYLKRSDMDSFKSAMTELSMFRKANGLGNDISVILQGNAIALANQENGDFEKAGEIFALMEEIFYELPKADKDIVQFAGVMGNYTLNLLERKKSHEAIDNQSRVVAMLDKAELTGTGIFVNAINVLYSLLIHLAKDADAEALKQKYLLTKG